MPNVLDAEPVRAFAKRAGAKIENDRVRARFERLAFERLIKDERNFRPATAAELDNAPPWAQAVAARGEPLFAFKLHRSASVRLHNLARWLQASCALALSDAARHHHVRASPRSPNCAASAASFAIAWRAPRTACITAPGCAGACGNSGCCATPMAQALSC